MEIDKRRTTRSFLRPVPFIAAGVFLTISLYTVTRSQDPSDKFKEQPAIVAEVLKLDNSPLLVTVSSVDNSPLSYQLINLVIQNVSEKKIKAYVIAHSYSVAPSAAGTSSSFHQEFVPGEIVFDSIGEARANVKAGVKLLLSLDFVRFTDGTTWGPDSQQQSQYISGQIEGETRAAAQISRLLEYLNTEAVVSILSKTTSETDPPFERKSESEKWWRGATSGYRGFVFKLQSAYQSDGIAGVKRKLDELRKLLAK